MSNSSAIASIAGVIDATNLSQSRQKMMASLAVNGCSVASGLMRSRSSPCPTKPALGKRILRPELIPTSSNRSSSEPVSNSTIPLLLNCCLLKSKPAITPLTHTRTFWP